MTTPTTPTAPTGEELLAMARRKLLALVDDEDTETRDKVRALVALEQSARAELAADKERNNQHAPEPGWESLTLAERMARIVQARERLDVMEHETKMLAAKEEDPSCPER